MKTPNTCVIAFCGPDGTGKSTIANLLSITLSKSGYLTKRIWIKNVHLISYFIVSALETLNKNCVLRSSSGAVITSCIANNHTLWTWFESFNIVLKTIYFILLKGFYRLLNKKLVFIADRFILDSMVHVLISVLFLKFGFKDKKIVMLKLVESFPYKVLRSLSAKYSVVILLDGKEEVLIERKKKTQKHDPYWYLKLQRILYRVIARTLSIDVYYIDTTKKSIHEVYLEVLNAIKEVLKDEEK
ncbi:MAG: hypothetical protein QW579_08105 [Desulfurococcaceae archaeon]